MSIPVPKAAKREERVFSGEEGEEGEITPSRPGKIAGEPSSASPDSFPLGSPSRIPCLSLHPLLALLHIRLIAPTLCFLLFHLPRHQNKNVQ